MPGRLTAGTAVPLSPHHRRTACRGRHRAGGGLHDRPDRSACRRRRTRRAGRIRFRSARAALPGWPHPMNDPTPPGSRASRGTAAGRTREVRGLGDCRTGASRVPWRRCQTPATRKLLTQVTSASCLSGGSTALTSRSGVRAAASGLTPAQAAPSRPSWFPNCSVGPAKDRNRVRVARSQASSALRNVSS